MIEQSTIYVNPKDFALCICTYKRQPLLNLLLTDLAEQTLFPGIISIVDGDPSSGKTLELLKNLKFPQRAIVNYIPSTHANLAYQRYIGWLSVKDLNPMYFLYLDDDLRLTQKDAIQRIIAPLTWTKEKIIGVTAETKYKFSEIISNEKILADIRNQSETPPPFLVRVFGSSRKIAPGGIAPSGHRKAPVPNQDGVAEVKWLQGRVMAYSLSAITQSCFSEDLFAITAIQCGLGEDTFLSSRIGRSGKMLYLVDIGVEHPDNDLPNSYPIQAYKLGYATSYSRRLLNDEYNAGKPVNWMTRFDLIKSYLGTALLAWLMALRTFQRYRAAYAIGYTLGALRGLFQSPKATTLTPDINWWQDAESNIQKIIVLNE